jgi:hypothetical protein
MRHAMLTLPPAVLRDPVVEIQHFGAATNAANQQLSSAYAGAVPTACQSKTLSIARLPR